MAFDHDLCDHMSVKMRRHAYAFVPPERVRQGMPHGIVAACTTCLAWKEVRAVLTFKQAAMVRQEQVQELDCLCWQFQLQRSMRFGFGLEDLYKDTLTAAPNVAFKMQLPQVLNAQPGVDGQRDCQRSLNTLGPSKKVLLLQCAREFRLREA